MSELLWKKFLRHADPQSMLSVMVILDAVPEQGFTAIKVNEASFSTDVMYLKK